MSVVDVVGLVLTLLLLLGMFFVGLALIGSAATLIAVEGARALAWGSRRVIPRRTAVQIAEPRAQLASDAAREQAAAMLARGYVRGSLTLIELEERLDQALLARTITDLGVACRGLPG